MTNISPFILVSYESYDITYFGVIKIQYSRTKAEEKGLGRFFSVWENLSTTELAEEKPEKGQEGFTVFTVSDKTWLDNIPAGPGDNQD